MKATSLKKTLQRCLKNQATDLDLLSHIKIGELLFILLVRATQQTFFNRMQDTSGKVQIHWCYILFSNTSFSKRIRHVSVMFRCEALEY